MTTSNNNIDRDALTLVLQDRLNNNSDPRFYSGAVLAAYHRISSHRSLVELAAIELRRCGLNARVLEKWLHEPWMVDEFVALCASKFKYMHEPDCINIQMEHGGVTVLRKCYAPQICRLLHGLMQVPDDAKTDAMRLVEAVPKDSKPEPGALQAVR